MMLVLMLFTYSDPSFSILIPFDVDKDADY